MSVNTISEMGAAAICELQQLQQYNTFELKQEVIDRTISLIEMLVERFLASDIEPIKISVQSINDECIDVYAVARGYQLIFTIEPFSDNVNVFYDDGDIPFEDIVQWNSVELDKWICRLANARDYFNDEE